jgi:BlaI family penicillinase repressor
MILAGAPFAGAGFGASEFEGRPAMPSKPGARASGRARGLPRISEAEWAVMRVIWSKSPITANGVVEALASERDWKPKTIHTLLRRLAAKGALAYDKQGREYRFRPTVDPKEYVRAASRSFLGRFFNGELAPFLACLLEGEDLTREEVEELRRILDGARP